MAFKKTNNTAITKAQPSSLQLWGDIDDEAADALSDIDAAFKKSGGSEFMKLDVGKNTVRFMPPKPGTKDKHVMIHEHFVDNLPGHDGTFRFVCPRMQAKMRCPRCEEAERMMRSGNVLDRKEGKGMFPALRIYSNVINRKAPEEGPKILTFGKTIWEQLKKIRDDVEDGGKYWNPGDEGFDIVIERTGTGKNDTEYTVRPAKKNSPLHPDPEMQAEWADMMFDLSFYAMVMDPAELLDALGGGGGGQRGRRSLNDGGGRSQRQIAPKSSAREEPKRGSRRTAQEDAETLDVDAAVIEDDDDVPL